MAAFQFPDPAVETTVVNPITGSTYQWKEPPGKWIVTTKLTQGSDIIYEGDSPPDPRGDYKLWYSTDTLELYFWYEDVNGNGAWVPTAAPITMLEDLDTQVFDLSVLLNQVNAAAITNENEIELIKDSLGQVTLQEVLDNGRVADKGFVLTNLANDAILVSPEDARIMVGGIGPSVVPRIELRHDAEGGGKDTSVVKLELDENGERFDIECDEKVNNIHFRFENDDKLILNKKGDAEFIGKLKVAPADGGTEVPTFDQVSAIAELLQLQIDQITTLYERGAWMYDDGDGVPQGTEYVLSGPQTQDSYDAQVAELAETLNQCMVEAGEDATAKSACSREYTNGVDALTPVGETMNTNDWNLATNITFSPTDADGNVHTFSNVKVGQLIDMACDDGSGAMVAEIKGVTLGMWYEVKKLKITPLKTIGVANGKTRVKIFTLDDTVDSDALDNYVKKTGDTMSGDLSFKKKGDGQYWSYIRAQKPNAWNTSQETHGLILDIGITNSYKQQFKIQGRAGRELFKIYDNSGAVATLGGNLNVTGELKVSGKEVATENYVKDQNTLVRNALAPSLDPARFLWEVQNNSKAGAGKGICQLSGTDFNDSTEIRINLHSHCGNLDLFDLPGETIYSSNRDNDASPFTIHSYIRTSATANKWKYKGYAGIKEIKIFGSDDNQYLKLVLTSLKWGNGRISEGGIYAFTIPGLF